MPPTRRSSQPKETPARSRQEPAVLRERSLRACTRCRQRKQKCDNALPDCSNCIKGGVRCEAFPINVVSRDNLLQIYDQLQQSQRRNANLQEELTMSRFVAPDALAFFSAVLAKQVTGGTYHGDSCRQSDQASLDHMQSADTPLPLQSNPSEAPAIVTLDAKSEVQTATIAEPWPSISSAQADIWKVIESLECCFPAVAPAVSVAAQQFDQRPDHPSSGKLNKVAADPIQGLQDLLSVSTISVERARLNRSSVEMQASVEDWTRRVGAASSMTRVAATLLWSLFAIVQHRGEELLRFDTALTYFMQAWQSDSTSPSIVPSTYGDIPMSFFRAHDWIHLQTAVMTGKIHIQVTTMSSFEGVESIASKSDLGAFLASFHVEQKRLEYVALHLFSSPLGELTDTRHEEAVWNLLRSIKELSDVNSQSFDTFGVHDHASVSAQRDVLTRHKLGTQLYGMFPRMLFLYCPNNRRHWRWLGNALPLAATALSCHHAAWSQCGWLGDHAVDALTFADLLAALVWTLQRRQAQNDLREDVCELIRIGIQLGEQLAGKWPQYSNMILTAVRQLHTIRDSLISPSGLSTPWPPASTTTTSSSNTASSPVLRTPQAGELLQQPFFANLNPRHEVQHHHCPPYQQTLPQQQQQSAVYQQTQQLLGDWHQTPPVQPIRTDWSSNPTDADPERAFNGIDPVGLDTDHMLPVILSGSGATMEQQRKEPQPSAYTAVDFGPRTSAVVASLADLPSTTSSQAPAQVPAATPRPLLYLPDDRHPAS